MADPNEIRVIAVDDEDIWREVLEDELGDVGGVSYEMVSTADEAIARLEEGGFHGVVTDGLNGEWVRVAEAARSVGAGVLVVSAEVANVQAAQAEGMGGIDKTSFDSQEFGAIVTAFGIADKEL